MQPFARRLGALLLSACIWSCASAASAHAQIAFTACPNSNDFACGHLSVPLDPIGAPAGTITLALRRHRAPVGEARSAIITLAGGPGQPALPFAQTFAELLGPIAATRDLIVFDQRGLGLSHPLSCNALKVPGPFHSIGAAVGACARQLGADRAFYTTADTVADIEAIRSAGGYEKLVLYGTSYGTKVAEQYAQDYPAHVEALVLDSVVPPNGPETLLRSTFAAVPRILRQLCSERACAHVTNDPVEDLARLLRRIHRTPVRGRALDGHGRARSVLLSSNELLEILLAGDFSQLLRAELLTAVAAAARDDTAPLARLLLTTARGEGEQEDVDMPLYYATSCEEQEFPWSRSVAPRTRITQATAVARALPASAFAPFSAANALALSDVPACAYWPFSSPAPVGDDAPLPNVPTLILSGAEDLRTPTANAREVARAIPDAQLLVVPHTGHSVLTQEQGSCASEALQAMFAAGAVKPCRARRVAPGMRPTPLPPRRLALVPASEGYSGLSGRTLHAVALTLTDFIRQLSLRLAASGAAEGLGPLPTLRIGGLRAGWAQFAGATLSLHGYSYVPGVTITGSFSRGAVSLHVGGFAAAHGTLRLGAHRALVGILGARHVVLAANSTASAAIVGSDAQASYHSGSGAAARNAARRLAKLLGRLQP